MKRILLMIAALLPCFTIYAQNQFENAGFENWNDNIPTSWSTLAVPASIPFLGNTPLCDVSQSNEAVEGNYSVKLTPKRLPQTLVTLIQQFVQIDSLDKVFIPSLLTNATINITTENITDLMELFQNGTDSIDMGDIDYEGLINKMLGLLSDGLDISNSSLRVSEITGKYKFEKKTEGDGFLLAAALVDNSTGVRTLAGGGMYVPEEFTEGFEEFSIPIAYLKDADELIFFAISLSMDFSAEEAGSLYIDDLKVNYTPYSALNDATQNSDITLYPNPTSGSFRINTTQPTHIRIYDALGVLVKDIPNYNSQTTINLENKGVFFVHIGDKVEKICVE